MLRTSIDTLDTPLNRLKMFKSDWFGGNFGVLPSTEDELGRQHDHRWVSMAFP